MHSESGTLSFKVNLLQMLFNLGNFSLLDLVLFRGIFFNLLHTEIEAKGFEGAQN